MIVSIFPMRQNICRGYFAFDKTQMLEVVTWREQHRDMQYLDVESYGLAYALCNKDKKPLSVIGVGAGKFLGVQRVFARTSLNLSSWPSFGMTSKKRFSYDSPNIGRHFLKWNHVGRHFRPNFQGSCEAFHRFCSDFHGFFQYIQGICPDFTKSKLLGCACNPAFYTTAVSYIDHAFQTCHIFWTWHVITWNSSVQQLTK